MNEKRPNFLFIGGDRCGSKTVHYFLQQHPQCFVPPIADPRFFDETYERGLDWYFGLFADAPDSATAIGECSKYIHSQVAARRIAQDLPDIRIAVTLRHPIDRTYSSYLGAYHRRVIDLPLEKALDDVPWLIDRSMYADNVELYFELFGRDRVKVMIFDDLAADPRAFAQEIYGHLDLEFLDHLDYETAKSPQASPRFPLSAWMSRRAADLLRGLRQEELLGKLKSNSIVRSMFLKTYARDAIPQMASETRQRLRDVFDADISRLEGLVERDLSAWRQ